MASRRSVALWGDEHQELGQIGTASLGAECAIGLSRGRFPKGYEHTDPNEDAVSAVTDDGGWLLAVVDGHWGFDAARTALTALLGTSIVIDSGPEDLVADLFDRAHQAVTETVAKTAGSRRDSRTTLTVALVADGRVTSATLGDSSALLIQEAVRPLGLLSGFLGPETDLSDLFVDTTEVSSGDMLVLCTDGLSRFLGRGWMKRVGELTREHKNPESFVRVAIEEAFAGGAGDNIAAAVLRV